MLGQFSSKRRIDLMHPVTTTRPMDHDAPISKPLTDRIHKPALFAIGERVRWNHDGCAPIEGVIRTVHWLDTPEPPGYRYQITLDDGYQASAGFIESSLVRI
jgi:hypothetical protein